MTDTTSSPIDQTDNIRINDLVLPVLFRDGAQWPAKVDEAVEQLISITLTIFHDISRAVNTDDVNYSINYASLAGAIRDSVAHQEFQCVQDVARHICNSFGKFYSLESVLNGLQVRIKVTQPKAFLHSKAIALEYLVTFNAHGLWSVGKVTHIVEDLVVSTIIGIEPDERVMDQNVVVNIAIGTGERGLDPQEWLNVRHSMQRVYKQVATSNFLTLEALTSSIASQMLAFDEISRFSPTVTVRAAKPSALPLARSAEVQIVRTHTSGAKANSVYLRQSTSELAQVAIALGSNLGDSFRNIEYALRLLEIPQDVLGDDGEGMSLHVVNTSFLYETTPMYVTDQPSFINCACMTETNIPPTLLLRLLKKIENIVGRVPSIRNGPRAVDLDIIFYLDVTFDTRTDKGSLDDLDGELVIPHPRVQEREFVLRPLADMIPDYVHPVLKQTVENLLNDVTNSNGPPMNKVIPFPRQLTSTSSPHPLQVPETMAHWTYSAPSTQSGSAGETHVMATLNVTPDSFSDGAAHNALPAALEYACASVSHGATIIDIGGYSTRPGAAFVSVEDEISRVAPAIAALRDAQQLKALAGEDLVKRVTDTPISVDTFRWEVAEAALKAGANCINDVYAFTGPDSWPAAAGGKPQGDRAAEYMPKLKAVCREYGVPVVLMHSRGDAGKNKDYSAYQYSTQPTLEGVRVELGAKVDDIVLGKGGVRRWLVIVDPGIGFSKTLEGNLEILRSAQDVVRDVKIGNPQSIHGLRRNPLRGYSQLIGVSRKSFLGAILAQEPNGRETEPKERTWATAAAVSCAVQQGATVVRVHDVKEMLDIVKVSRALWL